MSERHEWVDWHNGDLNVVDFDSGKTNTDLPSACREIIRLAAMNASQALELERSWARNAQNMAELVAKDVECAQLRADLAAAESAIKYVVNESKVAVERTAYEAQTFVVALAYGHWTKLPAVQRAIAELALERLREERVESAT